MEIAFEYTDDNDDDEHDDEHDDDNDGEGEEDNDDEEENEGEGETANLRRPPVYISREQIMQLLGHAGLGRMFASDFALRTDRRHRRRLADDDDDDDDDGSESGLGSGGRTRRPRGRAAFEKVPSDRGRELMEQGIFGSNPRRETTIKRKKRLAYNIMRRELGTGSEGRQKNATRLLKQDMIPESAADMIIHYNARCYSGQFSDDGNFFFSCAQDFRVRMYDTSNPYDWKYYKVRTSLLHSLS